MTMTGGVIFAVCIQANASCVVVVLLLLKTSILKVCYHTNPVYHCHKEVLFLMSLTH